MRKVIRARVYDTDTASAVHTYTYSNPADHAYCEETLYRKRTGEYFLYGEGGPMSDYREYQSPNSWTGGEDIKPLTLEDAKAWAEEHMSGAEYEDAFGIVPEDAEKRTVSISITGIAHEILRNTATERDISLSALIEDLADDLQ